MCPKPNPYQAFTHMCYNNSYFHDDSINNEHASMETSLSHYQSMGHFFSDTQGHSTPWSNLIIWSKFELIQDFMHALVTCKFKKESDQYQQKNGDIDFLDAQG